MLSLIRLFAGLRARLFLLILVAILPMLGLILYSDLEQRQRDSRQVQTNALHLARMASTTHQDLIENARLLLSTLALLPQVSDDDPVVCGALLARVIQQNSQYANLAVAHPNGDVVCSAVPFTPSINIADRLIFQRALQTREFSVGGYQIGLISKKASLGVAYPLLDSSGQVQHILLAGLDLGWLNQLSIGAQLPEGSRLIVLDRNGVVLVRQPDPESWVGKSVADNVLVQVVFTHGEGTAAELGLDGVARLFAFTPLNSAGDASAYVLIGIPSAIVFAEQDAILGRQLLVLAVVTAIALFLAWAGANQFIVRRVNTLLRATRQLAAGDLSARTELSYGIGELSELARHFDDMANRIQQRQAQQKQIEHALRQAESKYHSLVEQLPVFVYSAEFGRDGKWLYASPQIEKLLGYTAQEWIVNSDLWFRQVHPDDLPIALSAGKSSRETGKPFQIEYRMFARDGRIVWVRDEAIVQPGTPEQPAYMQGIMTDVTERKRTEEELRESEERFRQMFSGHSAIQMLIDPASGLIVDANPAAGEFYGYPRDTLRQMNISEINQLTREQIADQMRIAEQRANNSFVFQHRLACGEIREVEVHSSPIQVRGRTLLYSIVHDITERKRAEEILRESEERFRSFIEQTSEGVMLVDETARIIEFNRAIEEMTGVTRDAVLGKPMWEFQFQFLTAERQTPALKQQHRAAIEELVRTGQGEILNQPFQVTICRTDGAIRILEQHLFSIQTARGYRLGTIARDVTEQKRIERELQNERDFIFQVVSAMGQGLTVTDEKGKFILVNPAYARMVGYSPEELLGKNPLDVTINENHATLERALAERKAGKTTTYETRFRRADGGHIHALITGVPRASAGEYAGAITVITDLTERNQMEERLRNSESLYHSLVEALPINLCRKDREGRFVFANTRFCEGVGKSLAEIVNKTDWDLHPPELAEKYRADDAQVIASGQTFEAIEEHRPLGGVKTFVQVIKTPVRDSAGNITGLQVVFWDMTERIQAEEKLWYLGTHDALTQLYNRAFFEVEMSRLDQSRQFPVSIMMIDVDGLKRINDQHGHPVGDAILQRAADVLTAAFRVEDVIARIGGDEFAVLVPNTDARVANQVWQRVQRQLVAHNVRYPELPLELSIGIATALLGTSLAETFKQADAEMYREKEKHRQNDG